MKIFTIIVILLLCQNIIASQDASKKTSAEIKWIVLKEKVTPEQEVFTLNKNITRPRLIECKEVIFPSNGQDFISESQFTLLLNIQIGADGTIERYCTIHKPIPQIDFERQISEALRGWKYAPALLNNRKVACIIVINLMKPMGRNRTESCQMNH